MPLKDIKLSMLLLGIKSKHYEHTTITEYEAKTIHGDAITLHTYKSMISITTYQGKNSYSNNPKGRVFENIKEGFDFFISKIQ